MIELKEAAQDMMEEALNFRDWKSTLNETVMAYRGGLALETEDGAEEMSKAAAAQLFRMVGLPVKVLDHFSFDPTFQVEMARKKLGNLEAEKRDRSVLCRGRKVKGRTVFDAFLTEEYVPISNFQILNAVVDVFDEMGVEAYAHMAQIHNRQLAMRIVAPEWEHDLGVKDTAYTGLAVINDEIGKSNLSFQVAVARVACFNYSILSEPVFEHSHRWLPPDDIMNGIRDGIGRLNDVAYDVSGRLREMRDVTVSDVAEMVRVAGQEIGMPNYAVDSGVDWWRDAGAHENLFSVVQAVEFGASKLTDRKGFHWWRRQNAEQQIYDMAKGFQETGKLELCACPSCNRPMNIIDAEGWGE